MSIMLDETMGVDIMAQKKPVQDIVGEWARRRIERGPLFEQCRRISQAYSNEVALPLPEVSAKEAPAVANLIGSGIDQHAMRIASVLPDVQCPPVLIGNKASEVRGDKRRRACLGYWETNTYNLLVRRRARSLIAYTQSPVYLRPDVKTRQPKWEVRLPTETYPADLEVGEMLPDDCIFAFTRTVGWLLSAYPEVDLSQIRVDQESKYENKRPLHESDPIDLIKWISGTEIVLVAIGHGETPEDMIFEAEYGIQDAQIINLGPAGGNGPRMWAMQLLRIPNRLEMCPVVVPGRITLNGLKGQFDDSIGLYQMQAKLMAMEVSAIANGIWPDQWLVSAPGQKAQVLVPADGRRGIIGEIMNGSLETTQIQPGPQTTDTVDRLERGIRLSGSIPANFGGESASNIRTAVQSNAVLGDAVDFTIQEHQEILAISMQHELEIASKIDLVYFGDRKKSFYVNWKGGKGRLDYTPKDVWTEDRTIRVSYAKAGTDANALDVQVGQKVGIGTLSKLSGMRADPMVADPEEEHGQVLYEGLEAAMLSGIQQQASTGALPLTDLAAIMRGVRSNDPMSLVESVESAQQAAQQRQSATVAPAEPGSPEAQPGLAQPGQGAEAGTAIAPPSPSAANLTSLLRGLRTGGQIAAQGSPGQSPLQAVSGGP